ncbi:hypothetical protein BHM03_00022314 [Ensete ventricosum]|nr:hypothetical protein BHM03_00022314 [Ensete ventricosum]
MPGPALESFKEVASGQLVSLLLAPTTPSLEAVAPHVRPSTEEGPTPSLPPTRVGPYVNSLAPLLGPLVAMSLRGETVDWPFTPWREVTLEDPLMVIPPLSDNVSAN